MVELLDFQHPDLCWKELPREVGQDDKGIIFEVGYFRDARRFRVYAQHGSTRGIFVFGGHVWRCTHPLGKDYPTLKRKAADPCDYYPGTEDTPPLPGQRCYNCGNLRAEWLNASEAPLLC